jgi:hypothetical protein
MDQQFYYSWPFSSSTSKFNKGSLFYNHCGLALQSKSMCCLASQASRYNITTKRQLCFYMILTNVFILQSQMFFVYVCVSSHLESDIGRIYIKGYLYPISYPKIAKKDIPLSFFWVGYVEGYNILILGIYKFLYPIL